MTPVEVARRVRNLAGDVSVQQFDNATLTDWMNDACRQIAVDNSLLQKTGTINMVIGTPDVTLPTDIFKLHSVSIDGNKIQLYSYEQFLEVHDDLIGNTEDQGLPQNGYIWAGKINVYPAPDKAYVMRVNYSYMPEAISYADPNWNPNSFPIPESYHNRIVTYCLAQVAYQDDDHNKYTVLMEEFNTGVTSTRHQGETEEDLYPHISVSSRDAGEYLEGAYELW